MIFSVMFDHGVMLTKNKGYQKKKNVCWNLLSKMRLSLLKRLTIVKITIATLVLCGLRLTQVNYWHHLECHDVNMSI